MARIDGLVFGYRKIKVSQESLSRVSSILLRAQISAKVGADGCFAVRERDMQRLSAFLDGRVEYEASELCGLPGVYRRLRYKIGLFSAVIASVIMAVISSNLVWDIRVLGNERLPDSAIVYALSECGFSVGQSWSETDRSAVESRFLSSSDDVSWININRRGSVAYVTVVEKTQNSDEGEHANPQGYANVVASTDCVIEEITVARGYAAVKPGDVVRAGDLLISGVLPEEVGGGFCHAEGKVVGRISDRVSVEVGRSYETISEKSETLLSTSIKIFGLEINIFKSYRNLDGECDIIKDVKAFSLFGKCKLPIELIREYSTESVTEERVYSDSELVRVATHRLNMLIHSRLLDGDLLRLRTEGGFTDEGYEMSTEVIFTAEVGRTLGFDIK